MSHGLIKGIIDGYVASEHRQAANEMIAFLDKNAMAEHQRSMIIREGAPFAVISSAVQSLQPDVLVIGTHGRSGIAKALLGSLTEEVLRSP